MNDNYMIYPLKNMRITQNYLGSTSHREHTTGSPKDYPIDEAGKDTKRDAIYCPCDEMKITAIRGIGNSDTNTVWLVSTSKVVTPTFKDIAFMTLTHFNDSDLKGKKVGDTFKRGEIICYEGTDGASANHIHLTAGRGYSDNWTKNSLGKWVITGNTQKPEDVFFIDRTFTKELWGGSLKWIDLPKSSKAVINKVERNVSVNQIEVLVDNLRIRTEPSTTARVVGYIEKGIYNYQEEIKNKDYTWYKIDNYYIASNPSWTKIYKVPEENSNEETPPVEEKDPEEVKEIRLIYTCQKDGKYLIRLKKGSKLYLQD